MTPKFVAACEVFQPAEKACWEILFRERADAAAIPATSLDYAMERTLAQLWSLLRARSADDWMRETEPEPLLPWLPAGCGLEQVLGFFGSGQRALELTLAEIERDFPRSSTESRQHRLIELRLAFNVLVQRGLDRLCGDCPEHEWCTLSGRHAFARTRRRLGARRKKHRPAQRARATTAPVSPLSTRRAFRRRAARANHIPGTP
ncbi:MAG TPA: hypothetical protein VHE13_13060 [Opitutus sp.]|nr:hypothetical protein [Opitutus sp.]